MFTYNLEELERDGSEDPNFDVGVHNDDDLEEIRRSELKGVKLIRIMGAQLVKHYATKK
jgi:hypothetical protein